MDRHKSRSAEGAHPSVRAPGLVPPAWVLGLPAPAETITSTPPADNLNPCPGQPCSQTCSHRTPKWVGSHQDPDDCWYGLLRRGSLTKSCREFQNRKKDPSWPRTYQGDQRGIRSEVVWKDSSSRTYKTWHGYQPPNQDRNPPKMEVFMKPCPFVDYIEWLMLLYFLLEEVAQNWNHSNSQCTEKLRLLFQRSAALMPGQVALGWSAISPLKVPGIAEPVNNVLA